jgi:hypothetical protein
MSATPKAPRDAVPEESTRIPDIRDNFAALYSKGVERVAEVQKRGIDIALQHGKEMIDLWKQATEKLPWAPRLKAFDQAPATLERFADAQKTVIDLVVEQTRALVEFAKDRQTTAGKGTDSVLNFAQQSFDRSVAAQKKAAAATVTQTKSVFENAREEFGFPGSEVVADSIQKGVDAVVVAQKELLETISA